jgi:hypothetical protein
MKRLSSGLELPSPFYMAEKSPRDALPVTTAVAIGTAAGKLASAAGVEGEPRARATQRKLPKKHNSRLPRRQKKAQKKAQQKAM